ncbi:DUF1360 domain-containing protein [Vulgatibacter sp.]|uniref:DUF1360 domain-containing protein n=1 Tax=Vulgatibacter sp. TaxID=1971226 RepID=UPI0035638CE5
MGISYTIAHERICAPLRRRLGGKETWLGYLVSCPYCNSHWIAFVLVPLTDLYYVQIAPDWGWFGWAIDWFLSSYLVVVIAAFLRVIFFWVDETQGLVRRRQVETEVETETQRVLKARTEHELQHELHELEHELHEHEREAQRHGPERPPH